MPSGEPQESKHQPCAIQSGACRLTLQHHLGASKGHNFSGLQPRLTELECLKKYGQTPRERLLSLLSSRMFSHTSRACCYHQGTLKEAVYKLCFLGISKADGEWKLLVNLMILKTEVQQLS